VGLRATAISARSEVIRRIFIPQSTMANGIRSVTPEVPRVSVQEVVQEVSRAQASLRATPEISMAAGTLSAGQAVSSTLAQADRLSVVRLSPDRDSIIPRLEIPLRTRDWVRRIALQFLPWLQRIRIRQSRVF
jgi:hypothetical protein